MRICIETSKAYKICRPKVDIIHAYYGPASGYKKVVVVEGRIRNVGTAVESPVERAGLVENSKGIILHRNGASLGNEHPVAAAAVYAYAVVVNIYKGRIRIKRNTIAETALRTYQHIVHHFCPTGNAARNIVAVHNGNAAAAVVPDNVAGYLKVVVVFGLHPGRSGITVGKNDRVLLNKRHFLVHTQHTLRIGIGNNVASNNIPLIETCSC